MTVGTVRRLVLIVSSIALMLAGTALRSADASPLGGQSTAGECHSVQLNLTTTTDPVTGAPETNISAPAGSCEEFDRSTLGLVNIVGIKLFGDLVGCAGAGASVTVDATFEPADRGSAYFPLSLTLETAPGGATVMTLKSKDLPPHFLGGGAFRQSPGASCTTATWTLGQFSYEDPTLSDG